MLKPSELFLNCAARISYQTVGADVNYAFVEDGDTLYIYFQGSKDIKAENGWIDWVRNFLFFPKPKKPHDKMDIGFKVHGGFLSAWNEVKNLVRRKIAECIIVDGTPTAEYKFKKIIIVGYSHGAALSGLCMEEVWYRRPDIRDDIIGFGFESPRFYAGWTVKKELQERWANYFVFRNRNDLVTKCPPAILRFCHVGHLIKIGQNDGTSDYNRPKCIGAHYPDKVYRNLVEWEKTEDIFND